MKLLKSQSAEHGKFVFNHSNYFDELYIKNGGFVATNGGTKIIEVNGDGAVTTTTAYTAGTITSTSANALVVGPAGATAPTFKVNSNTGSCATGVEVVGAAAAGGANLRAISSGTNEQLSINAKGSGAIAIGDVSTGAVAITPATTITGLATLTAGITGKLIVTSTETIAAGGTTTALSLTKFHHDIDADSGGDVFSLADGVQGQIVVCVLKTATGVATITPATFLGGTSITLNAAGDSVMLRFQTTLGWSILGGNSYAIV